jgi:hypothetical protein
MFSRLIKFLKQNITSLKICLTVSLSHQYFRIDKLTHSIVLLRRRGILCEDIKKNYSTRKSHSRKVFDDSDLKKEVKNVTMLQLQNKPDS